MTSNALNASHELRKSQHGDYPFKFMACGEENSQLRSRTTAITDALWRSEQNYLFGRTLGLG